MKRIALTLSILGLLGASFYAPGAFCQGTEYLRTRAGSLAAEEGPAPGEEAPLIEYYIAPEDNIDIFVWQNPDLTRQVIVGPDGKISYPLVGRVMVAGMTTEALEELMTEKLSVFIKYPQVSVMLRSFKGNKIILLGDINYPGIYTYKGAINLIEAVALGGDFTEKAQRNSVIVIRGNLTDNPQALRVNMLKAITRGTSGEDIILQPNDVVFVPRTFVANVNKFLDDMGPLISRASSIIDLRQAIRTLQNRGR
ncbi:polysaccharide biosynthesis/export family protein [Candidatus Omnitrophota bacterium]